MVTVKAAAKATAKAPGRASTAPSSPRILVAPLPSRTAPRTIKIEAIRAAVLKRTILVPTAVPKTLAASFAPRDQPKKRPLDKKKRIIVLDHAFYRINS